jgi:hypothetical protein
MTNPYSLVAGVVASIFALAGCAPAATTPSSAPPTATAASTPPATTSIASAVPPPRTPPPPTASTSATPPPLDRCAGGALDLDVLVHTDMVCPSDETPHPIPASSLTITADVQKLSVKRGDEGSFVVTYTNTTGEPLPLVFDASCGVPEFRAGVAGKPAPAPASASGSATGSMGGPADRGNCRAVLCHPHSVRVVLAPHGTAKRTIRFYAGDRPPYYCDGDPRPYPPGTYTVGVSSPVPTDGNGPAIEIPLVVTP